MIFTELRHFGWHYWVFTGISLYLEDPRAGGCTADVGTEEERHLGQRALDGLRRPIKGPSTRVIPLSSMIIGLSNLRGDEEGHQVAGSELGRGHQRTAQAHRGQDDAVQE